LADSETTLPTPHPKLRVASARQANEDVVQALLAWIAATAAASDADVRASLLSWLPGEYQPERSQSLDSGVSVEGDAGKATSSYSTAIDSRTPTLSSTTSSVAPLA